MEHFGYEGVCGIYITRHLKKCCHGLRMNKYFQFSNNIMLLKTLKAILRFTITYIKYVAMWSLVAVIRNCGIQLFNGTVKYYSSHTC